MTPNQRALLANRYQTDGMAASSPQKLLVLLCERLGADLDSAAAAIADRETERAHKALLNAQDIVFELQVALDPDAWDGAAELRSVYEYLSGLLVEANLKKSLPLIEQCKTIASPLIESWQEAYRLVQQGPVTRVPLPASPTA